MPTSVLDALRASRARLAPVTDVAHSDAEELLSRLLGCGRGELRARGAEALAAPDAARLEEWLARREAGEPVQYITGFAAFRDLDLRVDRRVLIPRPETELLAEAVLETLAAEREHWPKPRVLDLGTGSGALALAIAQEWPAASVTATDVSAQALELARENATRCQLVNRVTFVEGDWFGALANDERFEVIVSNPPYIGEDEAGELPVDVREWEPALALFSGREGLDALRDIVEDAARHLVAGGLLALELGESRGTQVAAWFEGAHDWASAELRDDLSGRPRMLLARREAGPAIAPAQWGEER